MCKFPGGKSILLVDDDPDLLQIIGKRCLNAGLEVRTACNLLSAMLLVEKKIPDVLCIDIDMPSGSGLSFCKMMGENPVTAQVPQVVLTGCSHSETLKICQQLGSKHILKSLDAWSELESHLVEILNQKQQESPLATPAANNDISTLLVGRAMPQIAVCKTAADSIHAPTGKTIVIAEDDEDMLQLLTRRFESLGCSVVATNNAFEAINSIKTLIPDMVCLDVNMPSGSGLSVCEMMSHDEQLQQIPVVILTGQADESTARRCHEMMAYYVEKSSDVWSRVEPLVKDILEMEKQHV